MFSLSFLNSSLLIASLATFIPILIYFFAKKRPDRVIFSSLKFIISSKEERNSKINLKNILLLIIRSLIILLLILLFARPIIRTFLGISSDYHAPTTISILADNSLSMDYYSKSTQKLEILKDKIKYINSKLTNNDYIRIYTKDDFITSQKFIQGAIPDTLIQKIKVTYNSLPLDSLVARALRDIKDIPTANHEIYLLTDGNEVISYSDSLTKINYAIVDEEEDWNNLAANISSTQIISNNNIKQISIDYTIHNYGKSQVKDKLIRLNYNDRSYDRFISLDANKSWQGNFTIPIEKSGWQKGFIEVQDEYFLQDNRSYFSFFFNLNPRFTIVSDDADMSLPLKTMVNIFSANSSNITYLPQNRINNQLISTTDIFIFYKLASFSSNTKTLLKELSQAKKGALIVLGPKSDSSIVDFIDNNFAIALKTGFSKDLYPDWSNPYNEILKEIPSQQFKEMKFNDLVKAEWKNKNNILLASEKQAIIASKNNNYLLFFDANNDFVTSASYPVFMNKVFEKLSNSNLEIKSLYQGDAIEVTKGSKINDKEVPSSRYIFKEKGIYKLQTASDITYLAVNLGEQQMQESMSRQIQFAKNYTDVSDNLEKHLFSDSASFELLKYLLYTILALFLAELVIVKLSK